MNKVAMYCLCFFFFLMLLLLQNTTYLFLLADPVDGHYSWNWTLAALHSYNIIKTEKKIISASM